MRARKIVTAAAVCGMLAVPAAARATHNTPAKTKAMILPLVVAYPSCVAPDTCRVGLSPSNTANGILPYIACFSSPRATPLKFGPKGQGFVKINAVRRGDVRTTIKITDVRNADDSPYTGRLMISATTTSTDDNCASDSPDPCQVPTAGTCTTVGIALTNANQLDHFQCTAARGTSTCKYSRYANATIPSIGFVEGPVQAGHGQNIEIGNIQILDEDGKLFLVPGLLVP